MNCTSKLKGKDCVKCLHFRANCEGDSTYSFITIDIPGFFANTLWLRENPRVFCENCDTVPYKFRHGHYCNKCKCIVDVYNQPDEDWTKSLDDRGEYWLDVERQDV